MPVLVLGYYYCSGSNVDEVSIGEREYHEHACRMTAHVRVGRQTERIMIIMIIIIIVIIMIIIIRIGTWCEAATLVGTHACMMTVAFGGTHLSCTTCPAHGFFKSGE